MALSALNNHVRRAATAAAEPFNGNENPIALLKARASTPESGKVSWPAALGLGTVFVWATAVVSSDLTNANFMNAMNAIASLEARLILTEAELKLVREEVSIKHKEIPVIYHASSKLYLSRI